MRKLIYYVACSVDGFIAREDGSLVDFSMGGEHFADLLEAFPETIPGHLREQLNVTAGNRQFDAVLMGRRTYQVGLDLGVTSPYPHLDQFVFSRSMHETPDEHVSLVTENPIACVRELKQQQGMDVWLCGGGELASAMLPEIDEVILKVNPFLMGSGTPLIAGSESKIDLQIQKKHIYDNGFMLLHYAVNH